jgi:8-oxo-dGTP pyrophosphatase MutT (NUDIX family)
MRTFGNLLKLRKPFSMSAFTHLLEQIANKLPTWNKEKAILAQSTMSSRSLAERELSFQKREKTRIAAVAILLFPDAEQCFFPLILRPPYQGVAKHGGQIGLPGGGKEDHDPDLQATALREVYEEIGVRLQPSNFIGCLQELYIPPSDSLVTPFIAYIDHKPNFLPDPNEVSHLYEVSFEELRMPQKRKEKTVTVGENLRYHVPYFDVANGEVWGATAMILNEFLHLVADE